MGSDFISSRSLLIFLLFIVEKQPIVSGIPLNTHEKHDLPTLRHVLNSKLKDKQ